MDLHSELKKKQLSDSLLDVHIPSYPGSPRSVHYGSQHSLEFIYGGSNNHLRAAVAFLHEDNELLEAAEIGNDKMLEIILRKGIDVQPRDFLGRNALHLAVCSDSEKSIILLLKNGVDPNVKDNLGMTPLMLCLMRRPSLRIANLLFDHGAIIMPRSNPMDTGLFLQFVMMSTPTEEEAEIMELLVKKGALINDPGAPGGRQALHFAAMSNNCYLIRILLNLGADLYLTNHQNETPKEVAITFKCKKAHLLLEQMEEAEYYATTPTSIRT